MGIHFAWRWSSCIKAEIFAVLHLVLLLISIMVYLTTSKSPLIYSDNWDTILGFFLNYLLPLLMAVLLVDGIRHRNTTVCKLWLMYEVFVLCCLTMVFFLGNWMITISSRNLMMMFTLILFKGVGMWTVLKFVREVTFELSDGHVIALDV